MPKTLTLGYVAEHFKATWQTEPAARQALAGLYLRLGLDAAGPITDAPKCWGDSLADVVAGRRWYRDNSSAAVAEDGAE
jgi:hypothetical protein